MHPATTETLGDLGYKYQFRLLYYTCALGDFGRQILPHLSADMFDQPQFKQLVTLIRSYWDKYGQLPNVDNLRLMLVDQLYLSSVDKEVLQEELSKFLTLRAMLANGGAHNDSQQVMELAWKFIQDRAMRSVNLEVGSMVSMRDYGKLREVIYRMQSAMQLGVKEDLPVSPLKSCHDVWLNRYPNAVPTGIPQLDRILPGGLPPGKLGLVLGGQGVGKSSILTLLSDNAWALGYHVLHIVFDENDVDTEVTPKYHAKWSGIPVDEMRYHLDEMDATIERVTKERRGRGNISIKRFDSAETTVRVLKTWIERYEERFGVHFDLIVMDYIDEVIPENKLAQGSYGEVEVVKSFHSMLVSLNRPGWTATQAKKESNIKRLLYYDDCGGSVAKLKKAQVVVTMGADPDQKLHDQMNVVLLKSNISKCGHIWEDCHFNRDTLSLKMSSQSGYAPEEEIRKTFDEGEHAPESGTGASEFTGANPRNLRPMGTSQSSGPAASPATSSWQHRLPESSFESESSSLAGVSDQRMPNPVVALSSPDQVGSYPTNELGGLDQRESVISTLPPPVLWVSPASAGESVGQLADLFDELDAA